MNTVLFDLDGTLLPMDLKEFTDTYICLLYSRMESAGYDAKKIIAGIWIGLKALVENNGMITNEECFWKAFENFMTDGNGKMETKVRRKLEKEINRFYKEDFGVARYVTRPLDTVSECVEILKEKGYQLVVATNPIFPEVATLERLSWAGLNAEDFSLITTYENSCYTKPNLEYYKYLLKILDKDPEDCLMVGNDVREDMCAKNLGIDVFLMEGNVINDIDVDISELKRGNWNVFREYVSNLPNRN
ncbi:MAG: HAD family hydrolase [Eubacterium sp.]|nr:HAD family hydrolase [Eubacterium sp.]